MIFFTWLEDLQLVPSWFWATFVFLLGLCIGSFLNVVIYRLPDEKKSIVWPGSHCPSCQAAIAGYDNIPVLSYLILGGKCRKCRVPISLIYPLVELLTGLIFLSVFFRFGFKPALLPNLVFISALIALIFIDFFEQILPDSITKPGLVLALALRTFHFNLYGIDFDVLGFLFGATPLMRWLHNDRFASIFNAVLGMLVGGGTLWLIGVGYFRLRRFRLETLEDMGAFLREQCVLGTVVRLRVRRSGRTRYVYIEGGDFSALSPEEQTEINFSMSTEGAPELAATSIFGVSAETVMKAEDAASPSGIVVKSVPKDSFAEDYGVKAGDVITHANKEGMGLGDVKMMFFVGAFLGWELTFLTLFIASLMGGAVAVYRLVTQGRSALQTAVPFGVMLGSAALLALFFGPQMIDKYMQFFMRLTMPNQY